MPKIVWDNIGEKIYESGIDHGVLYPVDNTGAYTTGVAWNGLTGVTESPSGAESTPQYADNIKYLNLISAEDFGGTIDAFTYPPEFAVCNGEAEIVKGVNIGQQDRPTFGMCYRTLKGNDVLNTAFGYKLHFIYGAQVAPSERPYQTISDSPEPVNFSWEFTTTPVPVTGFKPSAYVVVDSTLADQTKLATLEAIIYGSDDEAARLPLPDEIKTLMTPETP